jgi:SNF2 family DNA or RNA helicase
LALTRTPGYGAPLAVIVNYEAVLSRPLLAVLAGTDWDALVLDESHRIKKPGGKISRTIAQLARGIPHRLALTGTPISGADGPLGIWAQYRAIEPTVFPWTFTQFKGRYTLPATWGQHDGVTSGRGGALHPWAWHDLDDLTERMGSIAYSVESADVLDLPDHVDVARAVELEPSAMKAYRKLERDLILDLEEETVTAGNVLTRLLRLQQLTGGGLGTDAGAIVEVSTAKRTMLEEILLDIDPLEPVAVFCRFHHDLDAVADAAETTGRPHLELSGRKNEYHKFGRPNGTVIAVQIQAGGLGISLVAARYCVFYSLSYSLAEYDQARARVLRPGQGRSVVYLHLVAQGTVDQAVYQALATRRDVVATVTSGLTRGGLAGRARPVGVGASSE